MNRIKYFLGALLAAVLQMGCGAGVPDPDQVTAVWIEESVVSVFWDGVEGAEGYRIFKKEDEAEEFSYLCDVEENFYLDEEASGHTLCIYKIKTLKDGRVSDGVQSNPIVPGEQRAAETKSAGIGQQEAAAITSVTQMDKYTAVIQYESVPDAEQYRIYRSENEDGPYRQVGNSFDTIYYDEIENGTSYFYKVRSVSDGAVGELSEAAQLGYNAGEVFGVPVFMYHDFVTQGDLAGGVVFDEYAIWREEFEQDLRYLKENGYTTITAAQLIACLKGEAVLPEKPVMLTIDDGKLGVYRHAYPLLKQYGMTAVLAVIGERIDKAEATLPQREQEEAPYCTWEEIKEMSDSGALEIVSHSYTRHRYRNNGHTGANMKVGESETAFYQIAFKDYERMELKLKEVTGKGAAAFSYPYSVRSAASDRVWMKCGYELLLCGDGEDVRHSHLNYYVQGAGINYYSALTRRLVRMTGEPLEDNLKAAVRKDAW